MEKKKGLAASMKNGILQKWLCSSEYLDKKMKNRASPNMYLRIGQLTEL